jgi:hypothetical protein
MESNSNANNSGQYRLLVDKFAQNKSRKPKFEPHDFFGQLLRILVLELPQIEGLGLDSPTTIVLAVIHNVKTELHKGIYSYKDSGVIEVVDLNTIQCVVGRVKVGGQWVILDRSGVAAMGKD